MKKFTLIKKIMESAVLIALSPIWIPILLVLSPFIIYKYVCDRADRENYD